MLSDDLKKTNKEEREMAKEALFVYLLIELGCRYAELENQSKQYSIIPKNIFLDFVEKYFNLLYFKIEKSEGQNFVDYEKYLRHLTSKKALKFFSYKNVDYVIEKLP